MSIVAESPADVYCIPVKSVADRLQDDKRLRQIVARSTEAIFATVYDRYIELCTRSPQDRYDDLITRHPDLFSLFSLRDIASFLNITPTHLSRLRRITVGKSRR